jgi:hypothetical protein
LLYFNLYQAYWASFKLPTCTYYLIIRQLKHYLTFLFAISFLLFAQVLKHTIIFFELFKPLANFCSFLLIIHNFVVFLKLYFSFLIIINNLLVLLSFCDFNFLPNHFKISFWLGHYVILTIVSILDLILLNLKFLHCGQ